MACKVNVQLITYKIELTQIINKYVDFFIN